MKTKLLYLSLFALPFLISACAQSSATKSETPAVNNSQTSISKDTASEAEAVKNALNVGAKMPSFSLKDSDGKSVSSDDLLKQGNLVLVFYRGAWCPFCNLYLNNLQKNAAAIKEAGGNIIAISVENPDKSTTVAKKNELQFTVLSDPQLETARKFGIVYELPKETDETYKSKGLDVAKNNEMEKAELPLGATYIVNRKGEIVYAFLDPDYKKRAEPEVIIENLKKLENSAENK